MNEPTDTGAEPLKETAAEEPAGPPREARTLFAFAAGGLHFAVFAEETDGAAEGLSPAPLPHAPASVLGVVSVRGRMRTVLDTRALVNDDPQPAHDDAPPTRPAPRFVVALKGDEQLALAADSVEGAFEADAESLAQTGTSEPPVLATLERGGRRLHLLDASRLFDAAMRGTERRRPRA